MIVKALSLWEPWASLMRYGVKKIETRSWSTGYRGLLLICASKRWTREMQAAAEPLFSGVLRHRPDIDELDMEVHPGMAVALVQLVHVAHTEHLTSNVGVTVAVRERIAHKRFYQALPASMEFNLGDYSPGRYGWCTEPIDTDFEPFAVRGAQGLFEVHLPPEVEARVRQGRVGA